MVLRYITAPNGTSYYYNNLTKQSTYTRPLPTGIAPSFPPPSVPQTLNVNVGPSPYTQPFVQPFNPHIVNPHGLAPQFPAPGPTPAQNNTNSTEEKKKKKEKPKEKIPIPGTSWLKVTTNLNNVFYTDPSSKTSSWTIPDEIKDAVEAFEADVKAQRVKEQEQKAEEERARAEERRLSDLREREKVRLELEEEKRKGIELEKRRKREADRERERKRKERDEDDGDGEGEQVEGEEGDGRRAAKMAKLDEHDRDVDTKNNSNPNDDHDHMDDVSANPDPDSEDEEAMAMGPIDADDEEAWQRAVAAEIARETKIKDRQKKESKAAKKAQEEEAMGRVFQLPPAQAQAQGQGQTQGQIQDQGQGQGIPTAVARVQVDLNPDEGKALFKVSFRAGRSQPFRPRRRYWRLTILTIIRRGCYPHSPCCTKKTSPRSHLGKSHSLSSSTTPDTSSCPRKSSVKRSTKTIAAR